MLVFSGHTQQLRNSKTVYLWYACMRPAHCRHAACLVCRTTQEFTGVLLTNVVGTFAVTKSFLPLLRAGHKKVIVHISSNAASLSRNQQGIKQAGFTDASLALSYRASKAAVNMRTRQQGLCFTDLSCVAVRHSAQRNSAESC